MTRRGKGLFLVMFNFRSLFLPSANRPAGMLLFVLRHYFLHARAPTLCDVRTKRSEQDLTRIAVIGPSHLGPSPFNWYDRPGSRIPSRPRPEFVLSRGTMLKL